MTEQKFPTEIIDLPSEGKVYPKDSPLSEGKLEIKYMTAKEEDILTSQNLAKKNLAVEKLLNALIATPGVDMNDLILGDQDALMVAVRILAYGPTYETQVRNPNDTDEVVTHTFNLADCPFKTIPEDTKVSGNEFTIKLPISKATVKFKLLTGRDEKMIKKELTSYKKTRAQVLPELTTRLRYSIISVDGDDNLSTITNFVNNLLARDSLFLRQEIARVSPEIELRQEVEMEGYTVKVDIPLTVDFLWPNTTR